MKYNAVMDLHTHTLASGHAYNTIREMAKAASEKGLEVLGITEHAPHMPGSCQDFYFHNLKVVPREMYGIRLLLGTELNILDVEGHIDLNDRDLQEMDVVIASLHTPCIRPGTMEENTRACLNVMKNPRLHILGHPDDGRYALDYRALVEGAKEYGKILELNNHSLEPTSFRQNARENDTRMLELCREYGVPVIMSSDAHFDMAIGEFSCARALLEELDFPEDLVLNGSVDRLMAFLSNN
jgi:putative hydrolase